MTAEEQAIVERWQFTDAGRAEMALHGLGMSVGDLKQSACTRDGFNTIRKSRADLISARETIDWLIANTSSFEMAAE